MPGITYVDLGLVLLLLRFWGWWELWAFQVHEQVGHNFMCTSIRANAVSGFEDIPEAEPRR